MSEPVKIFVSYAHEDEEHKDVLRKQLAGLIRSEQIDLWDDRNLTAGDDWEAEILTRVEGCDVAIFLVSAAFLASEFINAKEYARMIERHEAGEARIFPIILRPSAWKPTEIGKIQVVPKDGKAVVTFSPENGERDQVWLDVTTALQTLLQSMGEKQADAPKPDAPKDTPSAPATLTQRLPRGQSRVLRALMQGRAAFFLGDDVNRKPEAGERAQVPRAMARARSTQPLPSIWQPWPMRPSTRAQALHIPPRWWLCATV
ncbi:MAG: toll/interleukin-1 receptor domain-containing protein [Pseudomonadota bacterium]